MSPAAPRWLIPPPAVYAHLSGFVTCGSRIKPSTSRDAVHYARFARLLLFIFYFFVGYAITLGLPNVLLELHAATPRHVPVSSWFTFFASFQQPRCRPLSLLCCELTGSHTFMQPCLGYNHYLWLLCKLGAREHSKQHVNCLSAASGLNIHVLPVICPL